MNVAIVGHVDHGKSTLVGRLLADSNSLPDGKLEQVRQHCERHARVFEYAYLLDALKSEQAQGITIDSARCFFSSPTRHYVLIDAPGHIEFLKNMISGAARADAALLVIDAHEGVMENSKRHGYLLKMLGIAQMAVVVNKLDLCDDPEEAFAATRNGFDAFLEGIGIRVDRYVPVCARDGSNVVHRAAGMPWYTGPTVLETLDGFSRSASAAGGPLRLPVQDVYKFTDWGDSRRIVAGRIESGHLRVGDRIVVLPLLKDTAVRSIEEFGRDGVLAAEAGQSTGVTLADPLYVKRGNLICKVGETLPTVGSAFAAHIFWMGRDPLIEDREYTLRLTTTEVAARVREVTTVMNASSLAVTSGRVVARHDVAECVIETGEDIWFDCAEALSATSRFVLVDHYDIAGGGIITAAVTDAQAETRHRVFMRELKWDHSLISAADRAVMYAQQPRVVLITGRTGIDKKIVAKRLEKRLFETGRTVYFLGIGNLLRGVDADLGRADGAEHVRRFGEVSHILLDAGLLVLATASDLMADDVKALSTIIGRESLIVVNVAEREALPLEGVDLTLEASEDPDTMITKILAFLRFRNVLFNPV